MVDWLDDLTRMDTTGMTIQDVMNEDIEATMHRVLAREPYQTGKFSRKAVNQAFRDGRHRELMRQQRG